MKQQMLSRMAEALWWIGRYVERSENLARLMDVYGHALLEGGGTAEEAVARPLLRLTGLKPPDHPPLPGRANETVQRLLFARSDPASLAAMVRQARENARAAREHISRELWEELNKFHWWLLESDGTEIGRATSLNAFLWDVKNRCHLLQGLLHTTVRRDAGWHFLLAGTYLERAYQTAYFLQSYCSEESGMPLLADAQDPAEAHRWSTLLRCCSGYEAYRRAYALEIRPHRVVELLLKSRRFPRSVLFSLTQLEDSLLYIAGTGPGEYAGEPERRTGRLRTQLLFADFGSWSGEELQSTLASLTLDCNAIAAAVAADYFGYQLPPDASAGRPRKDGERA